MWTGGRPLPVTGTCGLDLGEFPAALDANGLRIALDGGVRTLTAGTCMFGSSVAVGEGGLSSPVDSISFRLNAASDFMTSGGATMTIPAARRYEGRKGPLQLIGTFTVTTEAGAPRPATTVALSTGTWVVTVTKPPNGNLRMTATLEGRLTIS